MKSNESGGQKLDRQHSLKDAKQYSYLLQAEKKWKKTSETELAVSVLENRSNTHKELKNKIKNKKTAFNWTKQDKMREFSRKTSFFKLGTT